LQSFSFSRGQNDARLFGYAAIAVAVIAVTLIIPTVAFDVPQIPSSQGPVRSGIVAAVEDLGVRPTERGEERSQRFHVLVEGERLTIERSNLLEETNVLKVEKGDEVLVASSEGPDGNAYFIADRVRNTALWLLALAFVAIVLFVARSHGAWSLLGLAISFAVIIRFIIPGILAGYSPALIAFVGAVVIMGATLYLSHGLNRKASVALTGTALALLLTIVLAEVSIEAAALTGLVTEEATTLHLFSAGGIDVKGLLLGSIIIGALGVLDDVTIAQASTVQELREANSSLSGHELFRRGMNVGRDHIASTVNTLCLAYTGAALPLLIILATQDQGLGAIINQEVVATEVVRTLVGGIGIASAVPVTTALAAWTFRSAPLQPVSEGSHVVYGHAQETIEY
jgi:uncharacterized membrane protein